ncbi:MAG: excinuclease subunit UvrA [Bacteroidota bacterium]|jgi:excinuclease ABC subunit A
MSDFIEVKGARVHNLKNVSIDIPKQQLVVITGVSGSGKSSLAFDTIYAEGQRRYMESFSAYARQFVGSLERPDVDKIDGLSPVISIEQKTTNRNPRSTVGTVTEIYDFLRLLFARAGKAISYNTGKPMVQLSEEQITTEIYKQYKDQLVLIMAPLVRGRKGHYRELFESLRKKGFLKVRIDGEVQDLSEKLQVDRYKIHDIEVVIDRVKVDAESKVRISQSVQKALQMGDDLVFIQKKDANKTLMLSKRLMCIDSGLSYQEPSPNTFSFNSPYGYCPSCRGLGIANKIDLEAVIPDASKTINEGGIVPLGVARDAWHFNQVKAISKQYKFKLDTPINKLGDKILNVLLHGKEDGTIEVEEDFGTERQMYALSWEGICNMVVRWFNDTSSEGVKQWAEKFMQQHPCEACNGTRLQKESLWFKIADKNIAELSNLNLDDLQTWFTGIEKKLDKQQLQIATPVLKEIRDRLDFLLNVGLNYLSLNRPSKTLSGGESQRIRLATQIGSKLQGITYILDEPSIGLHQRDNQRLITALQELRDAGNTILVVEHDKDIMLASDHLIDIGPRAGIHGGQIVSSGTPKQVLKENTATVQYLNGTKSIEVPKERRKGNGQQLVLSGASGNNLHNVSCAFPLGTFIGVSGVSGSGKSTLIRETLYPILSQHCYESKTAPLPYTKIEGLEHIDKIIEVDQNPIGRSPRSNPATYCKFFDDIRQLFAIIPEAKIRGYKPGRFSFNVKGGRCDMCEGGGQRVIEMNFLPHVYVNCEKCNGRRYNRETLEIKFKGKNISDVLNMTVDEACEFFKAMPSLYRKIKTLADVGLGYITLGQSALTLSGGEAQRVKLATELSKRDTGKSFYILDEPTTGLHFQDIHLLINVLQTLVDRGNTVLVIEHNLDVLKVADHLIDIGPDGGSGGGYVVAAGTPEQVAKSKKSITGKYLAAELK